jgi:uncharacterized cupin superfamily protein
MPKIDISKAVVRTIAAYPVGLREITEGREKVMLGDVAGLTQFGVNLTRMKPGAWSAQRHWHEQEDEFVYIVEGEVTLIEDSGETVLRAGDCAGWKAGDTNGHCLVNKSNADVVFIEIGTRAPVEHCHYPDVDLQMKKDESGVRFMRKNGDSYSK